MIFYSYYIHLWWGRLLHLCVMVKILLHLWLVCISFMVGITFMVDFYYIYGWLQHLWMVREWGWNTIISDSIAQSSLLWMQQRKQETSACRLLFHLAWFACGNSGFLSAYNKAIHIMTNTRHVMHVQSSPFAYKPINFVFFFYYSTAVAFGRGQGGCSELPNENASTSVLKY